MEYFTTISSEFWIITVLGSASIFTILWGLDALTHKKLVEVDLTDKELQTHRHILIASFFMEISLVLTYWFGFAMLPFFIAFFIVRTVHEFIDELHFHVKRCSAYESYLHLGMWMSVLVKTSALFMWGFLLGYDGFLNLHFLFYVWLAILLLAMAFISYKEWYR
jgi:hypothetical protein